MLKEQKINWNMSDRIHSTMHADGIEHEHGKLTLLFDEQKAHGLIELTKEHEFRFGNSIEVPDLNKSGEIILNGRIHENGTVDNSPVTYSFTCYSIPKKAIELAKQKPYSTSININGMLDEVRSLINRIPEARKLAEEAEINRKAAYKVYTVKQIEQRAIKDKAENERHAAISLANKQRDEKKFAWIKTHGSAHLKRGVAAGHSCHKQYALEIGRLILGTMYEMDYDETITPERRSCPSVAALDELDILNQSTEIDSVKIVWLPNHLDDLDPNHEQWTRDGCEGIEVIIQKTYYYQIMK